jgi:two-component system OmpR family sensor kinase
VTSSPTVPWSEFRTSAVEFLVQLALAVLALAAVGRQDPAGWSGRTIGVLVFTAGVAVAVLLATGGWASDNRRAVRMGAAVAVYAGVVLLPAAVGADPATGMWALASDAALLGVVGYLALAVRASADRRGDRITAAVLAAAVAVVAAVLAGIALLAPAAAPPDALVHSADLIVWSGAGAGAVVVFIAGTVADRSLLRGTALGFATLAAGHAARIAIGSEAGGAAAAALQLAAVAMLLAVAVRFVRAEVGVLVGRRARLAEAEAAIAASAERNRELRELAVGLSGAARVLAREGADVRPRDRRLLAAAGTEFERLHELAGGRPGPATAPLARVLGDVAAVHRANGLEVEVEIEGDPGAPVAVGPLSRVLTGLLVDCAEHAPGARVRLLAEPDRGRLRVEIADGPALPAQTVAALVQRGGTGPRPVPSTLGPALTSGRALVVTSSETDGPDRWTAEIDLPVVDEPAGR